ncbi:MAG: hypothetical protein Q4G40_04580 [Brachybacterium sp.]|nr:hypothetical protein [Brachybacterium sp.]
MTPRRDALARLAAQLRRTNYAGRTVSLGEGVAVIGAATLALLITRRPLDALVTGGIGALGLADDLLEQQGEGPATKGLRGHFGALARGRLTTGGAKALGIPALCLLGAALAPGPRRPLLDAALAAGCANLMNLLDLRPGRALKAMLPVAALLALPVRDDLERSRSGAVLARIGGAAALLALPADLAEHGMLGDAGANTLGALTGTALARRAPGPVVLASLVVVTGLTLLSERVSFSAAIEASPPLRALDRIGRRGPR